MSGKKDRKPQHVFHVHVYYISYYNYLYQRMGTIGPRGL